MKYTHTITEAGNGLPDVGAKCYDSTTDELLTIKNTSMIHTQIAGKGNFVFAVCEVIGDAQTLNDTEFEELTPYKVERIED